MNITGVGYLGATIMMLAIWLFPVLFVAASRKGNGVERALWALVCVFASWLGYIGFVLSTRGDAGQQGMRNG